MIHEVNDGSEVACISAQAVRCPGEDAAELALANVREEFVIHGSLTGRLCRMALAPNLGHVESFALRKLQHLFNLRIDGQHLPFFGFARLPSVEAVANFLFDHRLFLFVICAYQRHCH